jgi:lysophospholipase L1-like esterase
MTMRRFYSYKAIVAAIVAGTLFGCGGGDDPQSSATEVRQATWYRAQNDMNERGVEAFAPDVKALTHQTLRQIVHVSVGGKAIRVKFSNLFGSTPLVIDKVHVAKTLGGDAIQVESDKALRFAGQQAITIAPGQESWSDDLAVSVEPRSTLVVSMHVAGTAELRTGHRFSRTTSYVAEGDQVSAARLIDPKPVLASFILTAVDVTREGKTPVIVAIGDSLTQGGSSTIDAFASYPEQLSDLLNASATPAAVVNSGIGGGRLVKDVFGPCGLCRLDRDVLQVSGATHAILLFGINDISWSQGYSRLINDSTQVYGADVFIATLKQAIEKAKAAGLKVYVGTVFPQNTLLTATFAGQAMRTAMNDFIRTQTLSDGVVDFDAVLRDPAEPLKLNARYDSGDGTHPNDSGYAIMAQEVKKIIGIPAL